MLPFNNTSNSQKASNYASALLKILPIIAFAVPLMLLFLLNPKDPYLNVTAQASFELMWKGRTFQIFFLWLATLELILSWGTITTKINTQNKARLILTAVTLALPGLYLFSANYFGLNSAIANWSGQIGVEFYNSMPLALEYLAFSMFFCLTIFLVLGIKGLKGFALPALFLVIVGALYTIDNVFPRGEFTPFQLLVPTTANLAAGVLGLMGNTAVLGTEIGTGMPTLLVSGPLGTTKFAIAWPCAGIEGLLIFTAVALLFMKRMGLSWKAKISYFAFGAAVTYFINVLRIATIFTIGMQFGAESLPVKDFHYYYGPLYSMTWIISYPLIILLSQSLWQKRKKGKLGNINQNSQPLLN